MWRANHIWLENSVYYSQSVTHWPDGYRQDCSGYVSLCWATSPPGGSTVTLVTDGTMYEINQEELQPGDAIGHCGPGTSGDYGHIQLWEGWDGDGYWVWEQAGGGNGPDHNFYYGSPWWNGYAAYRFIGIEEDGMAERDAELAASWATTGSDVSGWVDCPEAWSIINYSNRSVEERLAAKLDSLAVALDSVSARSTRALTAVVVMALLVLLVVVLVLTGQVPQ